MIYANTCCVQSVLHLATNIPNSLSCLSTKLGISHNTFAPIMLRSCLDQADWDEFRRNSTNGANYDVSVSCCLDNDDGNENTSAIRVGSEHEPSFWFQVVWQLSPCSKHVKLPTMLTCKKII